MIRESPIHSGRNPHKQYGGGKGVQSVAFACCLHVRPALPCLHVKKGPSECTSDPREMVADAAAVAESKLLCCTPGPCLTLIHTALSNVASWPGCRAGLYDSHGSYARTQTPPQRTRRDSTVQPAISAASFVYAPGISA